MTVDQTTIVDAEAAAAAATAVAPAFGPNAVLAVSIANGLLTAAVQAANNGVDVTDDQFTALLNIDDAAKAADLAAQQAASA